MPYERICAGAGYIHDDNNKNQLMKVLDKSNHPQGFKDDSNGITDPADDYEYDFYGNLIKDTNKEITNITYNHLNLPSKITFANGTSIEYLYNAVGQKVRKIVRQLDVTNTDYMGGFQYVSGMLSFFPHTEGYDNVTVGRKGAITYNYVYQYKDHLGNNRLSFTLDPNVVPFPGMPEPMIILEENHYYPFGLKHTNYNTNQYEFVEVENGNSYYINIEQLPVGGVGNYKYKYNGKEYQDELGLNMYDYGARNYDPALGRWMNMDAMAEKYFEWSPYNYTINNPINVIDPDGNDILFILFKSEKEVGHAGIAVSNYKKDKEGNYLTDKKGNYIESGTYTYYSFAPTEDVGEKNYDETVNGNVTKVENVTMDDILNSYPNVAGDDKVVTGVLKFETSKNYDDKVIKDFEDASKMENKRYNLITNNCTTFSARAFTNKKVGKETVVDGDGKKSTLYTENKMFKDLAKTPGAKTILNPGSYINKTAQQRYNDNKPWWAK